MKNTNHTLLTFFLLIIISSSSSFSQDNWPRVIIGEKGVEITVYQPQIESFKKDILQARSAVMVKMNEQAEPVFGAIWVKARVMTDVDTRIISLDNVEVTDAKFPNQDSSKVEKLKSFLSVEIPKWEFDITIDQLIAGMETEKVSSQGNYKNEPPEIIYVDYPAVLITIEGDPVLKKLENTSYEYVVNTPFFIISDSKNKTNYLKGGLLWYRSDDILKNWKWTNNVPSDLVKYVKENSTEEESDVNPDTIKVKPEIIVRTKTAELIETTGKPDFASIEGTSLLYLNNTESNVLMDINSQMYFVLISGRWFQAKSLEGPWSFVDPEKLPDDFANIPDSSDMSNVLSNVPGTEQSRDAILDTQVPQTAKVERDATVEVTYDGKPQFEPVENTDLEYAVNTDKSVIKYYNTYYCCDNAVWYESSSASGPWKVTTSVPEEIYKIGPESPVYNVTYVYVYDYTPSVVYVGYYPGYTGCYVYHGTVIYGTGYDYRPWYGAYYYPRPVTYGFSAHYNPYTGWSFGFGMSFGSPYGWFSFSYHSYPYHGGYWGPGGYHAGYNRGYYQGSRQGFYYGYKAGQNSNRYNRPTPYDNNRNLYQRDNSGKISTNDRQRNNVSTMDKQRTGNNINTMDKKQNKIAPKNDVYSDKQGNVYKRDNNNQWQSRDGNKWSNTNKNNSTFEKNKQDLNRQYKDRQQGNRNTQNFERQRQNTSRDFNRGGRRR